MILHFSEIEIWFQSDSNLEKEKEESKKLAYQIDKLKEENRHLKEEYEKYKIRTNYLIKSAKQTSKVTLKNKKKLYFKCKTNARGIGRIFCCCRYNALFGEWFVGEILGGSEKFGNFF